MKQNPEIISQAREEEYDRSPLKVLILAALAIAASVSSIYFFDGFLAEARVASFVAAAVLGGCAIVFAILNSVFVKSRILLVIIAVFQGFAPLGIFYGRFSTRPSWPLVIGAAVAAFLFAVASERGARLLKNSLSVRLFEISRAVVPKAVTALLIFFSVLMYVNYFEWGRLSDAVGRALVVRSVALAAPAVRLWFPSFSGEAKVGELLRAVAREQLMRTEISDLGVKVPSSFRGKFDQLPPPLQEEMVGKFSGELQKAAEEAIGPLDADESLGAAAYRIITERIAGLSVEKRTALGIVVAISLFSLFKSVSMLFSWLIAVFAFLIFKFLVAIGFAYVTQENRNREFTMLS